VTLCLSSALGAGVAEVEQLRETITQWVATEKTISAERATFQTQREPLEPRLAMVQDQIKAQRQRQGISEALITTELGLLLAIPALWRTRCY
jgi:hypothetical protein